MIDELVKILHDGKHSLVVANGKIVAFDGRGVSDLHMLFKENPGFLKEASIADKVVGKAAAALMILAGIKEVYTDVISQLALDLFIESRTRVSYDTVVPHIINRAKTGWCPLETLCRDCLTPEDCFNQIEKFSQNK